MDETPREKWGMTIGILAIIIPGMIATDFAPDWNVLPFPLWLIIAMLGTGIAGAIATPYWDRGALTGSIAGGGAMLALWLYMRMRGDITSSTQILRLEFVLPAVLGAAPGLILFGMYARQLPPDDQSADDESV